jgi:hypothetical protein
VTYDNSNPNRRSVRPTPGRGATDRTISPTTWIIGAIAVVVVLGIAGLGLTGTKTEPNNTAITSTPNTTGTTPAAPNSAKRDSK